MKKAKRGMRVVHTTTGREGIITSVVRGIATVVFPDGSEGKTHTGSLHAKKGRPCLVYILGGITLLTGAAAGISSSIL